ncbi:hypothetical protein PF005_g5535 [Phytophthora fragariae]|nr:hypothetical protein PF003_g13956 [Phytophthora fragariae]KAE8934815.1 hypothetical protein PF009_g15211 [Phytophthora fragariae]KAE8962660.1 hypothetical protein PF011_g29302 [Phytophthora fragariae]KAE9061430.1 hypothetical protein PF010_g29822 [Phytophthora fragariae]KAE9084787.1 hypothetical protein PF007_g21384 [Phytophthora fragariae]
MPLCAYADASLLFSFLVPPLESLPSPHGTGSCCSVKLLCCTTCAPSAAVSTRTCSCLQAHVYT